jgi:hypothetical protein
VGDLHINELRWTKWALEISECATGNEKVSGYPNKHKNGAKFAW